MTFVRIVDVLFAVRSREVVIKSRAPLHARRSFFSSPPFPPGLKKMPVASDAKPFFAGDAEDDLSSFPSPSSLSFSSSSLLPASTAETRQKVTAAPSATNVTSSRNSDAHNNTSQQDPQHHWPFFLLPGTIHAHVPKPAKVAALLAADAFGVSTRSCPVSENGAAVVRQLGALRKKYSEHCVFGWSPADFYRVVADVAQYSSFLPWCLDSTVHSVRPLVRDVDRTNEHDVCGGGGGGGGVGANINKESSDFYMEMDATLTVGFSFLKEQYTSRVLLAPNKKVTAVLNEDPQHKRGSVLLDLHCVWEFNAIPGKEQQVEVMFLVSFLFKNPLYSKFIMSHVVSLMTRSFEKHCEKLYGPPSCPREHLAS